MRKVRAGQEFKDVTTWGKSRPSPSTPAPNLQELETRAPHYSEIASAFTNISGGAVSKNLNNAGHNQPSIGGSSARYQLPPHLLTNPLDASLKAGKGSR